LLISLLVINFSSWRSSLKILSKRKINLNFQKGYSQTKDKSPKT